MIRDGLEIPPFIPRLPGRWGRMDTFSRITVIEVGKALEKAGLLEQKRGKVAVGKIVGLIGGTRRGSLETDLEFAEGFKQGPEFTSPILFGYTLPNIALAEAASLYGLRGPVYAVFDHQDPEAAAEDTAKSYLAGMEWIDAMAAGPMDHAGPDPRKIEFKVIKRCMT